MIDETYQTDIASTSDEGRGADQERPDLQSSEDRYGESPGREDKCADNADDDISSCVDAEDAEIGDGYSPNTDTLLHQIEACWHR